MALDLDCPTCKTDEHVLLVAAFLWWTKDKG